MKDNVYIAHFTKGAMATVAAAICLEPQVNTGAPVSPNIERHALYTETIVAPPATQQDADPVVIFQREEAPSEWDNKLEREFRKLALAEAQSTITPNESNRLEQLNRWRDTILHPQPVEEILLQLKRDRILSKMEELLAEYVELEQASGDARTEA